MNIFQKIKASIYGPEFYRNLAGKPTSETIKYFFKFLLLVTIIGTIVISITAITFVSLLSSDDFVNKVISYFPAELTLNIKDGQISTNVKEPYKIVTPEKFASKEDSKKANLAVIDTKVDAVSFNSFEAYDTTFLITKNSLIYIKDGALSIAPVAKYAGPELNINRDFISSFIKDKLPIIRTLVWFIPIPLYIVLFIKSVFYLIEFFLWALVVWLVLKIMKVSNGYMHAYRVMIQAATLPIIVDQFWPAPWYVSVLLALIVVVINFSTKSKTA
ncbi:DUF1189 family protein [Candidatus Nomurabacteria bacterium]|nr:DUF1189 family protein [Candidatus Nomurabacteria bacterium]